MTTQNMLHSLNATISDIASGLNHVQYFHHGEIWDLKISLLLYIEYYNLSFVQIKWDVYKK